jgi:isopenicillin N synthase-like dioxygenase
VEIQLMSIEHDRLRSQIPIIDVGPLRTGGSGGLEAVGWQIAAACEGIGFFYVINHDVAPVIIDGAFDAARRFFNTPEGERKKITINKWNRGFMKLREVTIPGYSPDLKESFDLGVDLAPDHPDVVAGKPLHGPNQWPDLANFREPVESYFNATVDLSLELLRAFTVVLDVPPDFFNAMFQRPLASMRLIHYPTQTVPVDGEWGVAPHTDYGAITVLSQDATGGLEVKTLDGKWVSAPYVPYSFVVNIGDMMAVWTNDRFKSNPHRVINRSGHERFSIPLFLSPPFDAVVQCFESCQSKENPPKYLPVASGEYLLKKFNSSYAFRKKGNAQGA